MFTYNDSMSLLSEKIVSALSSVIAKEGLQVTIHDLSDAKIVTKLASLCVENPVFILRIMDNVTDYNCISSVVTWGNYDGNKRIRFDSQHSDFPLNSQIVKYKDDVYVTIPTDLPRYLHKLLLAIVAELI